MRELDYTDERGRKYRVALPDGMGDEQAAMGAPIGPPDLDDVLGWPEPFASRLHNLLFERGIISAEDAKRHPQVVQGAVLAAFKADAQVVIQAFQEIEGRPRS